MKLFSLLCAAFVSLAALAPTTANAGHDSCGTRTRVTYDRCGQPVYWTYTFVGRDHCGRPVHQWVQQYRGGYAGHGRDSYGHGRDSYGRDSYGHGRDSGHGRNYGHGHGYSRPRSGISFHFSR
jgi:hypothetical protein